MPPYYGILIVSSSEIKGKCCFPKGEKLTFMASWHNESKKIKPKRLTQENKVKL